MPPQTQQPEQEEGLFHSALSALGIDPEATITAAKSLYAHPGATLSGVGGELGNEVKSAASNAGETAKQTGQGLLNMIADPNAVKTANERFAQPGWRNKVMGAEEEALSRIPIVGGGLTKGAEQGARGNYAGEVGTVGGTLLPFAVGGEAATSERAFTPGRYGTLERPHVSGMPEVPNAISSPEVRAGVNRLIEPPDRFHEVMSQVKPMHTEVVPGEVVLGEVGHGEPGSFVSRVKQGDKTLSAIDLTHTKEGMPQIGMAYTADEARGLGLSKIATNRLLDRAQQEGIPRVETGPILSAGGEGLVNSVSRERPFTSEGGISPRGSWDISQPREFPSLQPRLTTDTSAGPSRALPEVKGDLGLIGNEPRTITSSRFAAASNLPEVVHEIGPGNPGVLLNPRDHSLI